MEVRFSNHELARVLLKPQQMRLESAQQAAMLAKLQQTDKADAEAARKLIVQATQLGRHLDVQG
jgi:hypothetical protein